MKQIKLFLILIFTISACEDDEVKVPNPQNGICYFEIFNMHGKKILERNVNVVGIGSWKTLEIRDPKFGSNDPKDSLNTFATLFISNVKTWDENASWQIYSSDSSSWNFRSESVQTSFTQNYYGSNKDWFYRSISGEMKIWESTENVMKGYFKIRMGALSFNHKWGKKITVIGYFSSTDSWQH